MQLEFGGAVIPLCKLLLVNYDSWLVSFLKKYFWNFKFDTWIMNPESLIQTPALADAIFVMTHLAFLIFHLGNFGDLII